MEIEVMSLKNNNKIVNAPESGAADRTAKGA